MTQPGKTAVFGFIRQPHTIIIARGETIRHFTIRPWLVAVAGSLVAAVAVGYLLATTYLVLRDDLLGAAITRQARMQHSYEDRIAALRSQVDRITSRQILDQKRVEQKMAAILQRQNLLSERHGQLRPILARVGADSLPVDADIPIPVGRPVSTEPGSPEENRKQDKAAELDSSPAEMNGLRKGQTLASFTTVENAYRLFTDLDRSLMDMESQQLAQIRSLTTHARRKTGAIAAALKSAGLTLGLADEKTGTGGPFVDPEGLGEFEHQVEELDSALSRLDQAKGELSRLPVANPVPGKAISSLFGRRKDPILGTPALHSGIDFRAGRGNPVQATASGKVIRAGWLGGYGRMVEIDHGRGLTTRYAHLRRVLVRKGQRVSAGKVVGKIGSSGRSTGPHLHYEVRKHGKAVNPLKFLRAGRKIRNQLL